VVPINPDADEEDLYYIMHQSGCCGIITEPDGEGKTPVTVVQAIQSRLPELKQIVVTSDVTVSGTVMWREASIMGQMIDDNSFSGRMASVFPEDSVAIMYTSGTTGKPKGVVLDHIGLINKSMVSTKRQNIGGADRLCLFFPLFHMFGNTCIALAGLLRGAALVMPCSKFEPSKILEAIPKERCSAIYGSPSMLIALVDHAKFKAKDWESLSKGIIGGAPCPMELMRRLVEDIGVSKITVAYGITETASWITMTHPNDPIDLRVSTIGTPLECNEVKIVDPGTGQSLPPDTPGELCTRGFLMKSYYDMPAATAAAVDPEGWFHTGDLGEMDQKNYVRITGRLKDVIERDGKEIYPVEIEEILYALPEVSEAQVFGFPDSNRGQEVAAWIKLKDDVSLSIDAVSAHVEARLEKNNSQSTIDLFLSFP
jgi:fatty-acyl-CoA synthase